MLREVSPEMHELVCQVQRELPSDSSFAFSMRLTDHLATYWRDRRSILKLGDSGEFELDYAEVLVRGERALKKRSPSAVKEAADDLDAADVPYYAPSLAGIELKLIQAFHDLARALLFYKASSFLSNLVDRYVMLTSNNGAQGAIANALMWFQNGWVPSVIGDYVELLERKIADEAAVIDKARGDDTGAPSAPAAPTTPSTPAAPPPASTPPTTSTSPLVAGAMTYMIPDTTPPMTILQAPGPVMVL